MRLNRDGTVRIIAPSKAVLFVAVLASQYSSESVTVASQFLATLPPNLCYLCPEALQHIKSHRSNQLCRNFSKRTAQEERNRPNHKTETIYYLKHSNDMIVMITDLPATTEFSDRFPFSSGLMQLDALTVNQAVIA